LKTTLILQPTHVSDVKTGPARAHALAWQGYPAPRVKQYNCAPSNYKGSMILAIKMAFTHFRCCFSDQKE